MLQVHKTWSIFSYSCVLNLMVEELKLPFLKKAILMIFRRGVIIIFFFQDNIIFHII